MVRGTSFSYKIDYFAFILDIINPEGHQNCIIGSKVTAILLRGWIWSIVLVKLHQVGCALSLESTLVHINIWIFRGNTII